jgi:hypothetical protein
MRTTTPTLSDSSTVPLPAAQLAPEAIRQRNLLRLVVYYSRSCRFHLVLSLADDSRLLHRSDELEPLASAEVSWTGKLQSTARRREVLELDLDYGPLRCLQYSRPDGARTAYRSPIETVDRIGVRSLDHASPIFDLERHRRDDLVLDARPSPRLRKFHLTSNRPGKPRILQYEHLEKLDVLGKDSQ